MPNTNFIDRCPLYIFYLGKFLSAVQFFWRKVTLNIGQLHCTGVAFVSQPSRPFQNFYAIWLALTSDVFPACSAVHLSALPTVAARALAWKLALRRARPVAVALKPLRPVLSPCIALPDRPNLSSPRYSPSPPPVTAPLRQPMAGHSTESQQSTRPSSLP